MEEAAATIAVTRCLSFVTLVLEFLRDEGDEQCMVWRLALNKCVTGLDFALILGRSHVNRPWVSDGLKGFELGLSIFWTWV